jgi:hypothetical protein
MMDVDDHATPAAISNLVQQVLQHPFCSLKQSTQATDAIQWSASNEVCFVMDNDVIVAVCFHADFQSCRLLAMFLCV